MLAPVPPTRVPKRFTRHWVDWLPREYGGSGVFGAGSPHESVTDKIRQYHTDYNNRPSNPISFMTVIVSTSALWICDFYSLIGKLTVFLQLQEFCQVHLAQTNHHFRRSVFSSQLKSKVGHILVKDSALRIMLNVDGTPTVSRSHTHPLHTQKSRLLTSYLSLDVPDPRSTQCMWDT